MTDAQTITEHKAGFIRAQVRQLSTPLQASPAWRTLTTNASSTQASDETDLSISDKTVDDILTKLNARIKQHNRNVFALQSQRHVAEQIDTLYWNEVSEQRVSIDANTTWVKKSADLCDTSTIHELPERYKDLHFHPGHEAVDEDVQKYGEMRARLEDLAGERDRKRQQLEAYRQLRELLRLFEGARENVQPNLVTKDGELSKELERMKALIARVTARMGQVQSVEGRDMDKSVSGNDERLSRVLGLG